MPRRRAPPRLPTSRLTPDGSGHARRAPRPRPNSVAARLAIAALRCGDARDRSPPWDLLAHGGRTSVGCRLHPPRPRHLERPRDAAAVGPFTHRKATNNVNIHPAHQAPAHRRNGHGRRTGRDVLHRHGGSRRRARRPAARPGAHRAHAGGVRARGRLHREVDPGGRAPAAAHLRPGDAVTGELHAGRAHHADGAAGLPRHVERRGLGLGHLAADRRGRQPVQRQRAGDHLLPGGRPEPRLRRPPRLREDRLLLPPGRNPRRRAAGERRLDLRRPRLRGGRDRRDLRRPVVQPPDPVVGLGAHHEGRRDQAVLHGCRVLPRRRGQQHQAVRPAHRAERRQGARQQAGREAHRLRHGHRPPAGRRHLLPDRRAERVLQLPRPVHLRGPGAPR